MGVFDSKVFNAEAFQRYVNTIPSVKRNALLKSGVLFENRELAEILKDRAGGNYLVEPMFGRIGGAAQNYDGATNLAPVSTGSYKQGKVVVGRMKAWKERDFADDISGANFMDNVARQVSGYWDDVDEATILAILKGIFGNPIFANTHTTTLATAITATTINSAIQKAGGELKDFFALAIVHSAVATQLENLKIVQYALYNDADGIQRPVGLGYVNGKALIVDDNVPVSETGATYTLTSDSAVNPAKIYYKKVGSDYEVVTVPKTSGLSSYYEQTVAGTHTYTSYILGNGAFEYCDCGVKVPYEMDRNPLTNGGETILIGRQRKLFAPRGFSFVYSAMASNSPTDTELASASAWEFVKNGDDDDSYPLKAIPICSIVSTD